MRYALMAVCLFFSSVASVASAAVQVSVGIALPGISIGVNLPAYPQLHLVPGYPVYYAPYLDANYFFYDGMYWIYVEDNWYVSYWYNGPWDLVYPDYVPLFVLRIPVYYYRRPPVYFRGWWLGAPPHWGEHWGRDWEHRHRGWNQWDLSTTPPPAPLPDYQREYRWDRYPSREQQPQLHKQQYRFQSEDPVVKQHYQRQDERVEQPGQQRPQNQLRWQAEPQRRNYPHQRFQPYRWPSTRDEGESKHFNQQRIERITPPSAPPQYPPAGPSREVPQWRGDDTQNAVPPVLMRRRTINVPDEAPRRQQVMPSEGQIQAPQRSEGRQFQKQPRQLRPNPEHQDN